MKKAITSFGFMPCHAITDKAIPTTMLSHIMWCEVTPSLKVIKWHI